MALGRRARDMSGLANALSWSWEVSPGSLAFDIDNSARGAGAVLRYACSNAAKTPRAMDAALALHSQIQHAVIGRSARGPHTQPEYLVEPEDAHLLVPFTNPGPNRANHSTT